MTGKTCDPGDVCAQHGLTCLEDLSDRGSTSTLVLHVQDMEGVEYALKYMRPGIEDSQVVALRSWTASGVTPRLIKELEPGYYLLEWLDGRSMAEVPADDSVPAMDIGRALAVLHRTPPLDETRDVRSSFMLEPSAGWKRLSPSLYRLAGDLGSVLHQHEPETPVLVHADLVPTNVILTTNGPKFIDPVGRRGVAARDLAQLAAAAVGRGRGNALAPLLRGYGATPPLLAEAFAWMLLFYLQKNLALPSSPFTQHLLPVAAALEDAADVETIMHNYLESV